MTTAEWVARKLVLAAQWTPFRGVGGYSTTAFEARGQRDAFPQAQRESAYFNDFFNLFPSQRSPRHLFRDRRVLDFGSGYGGRTIEYVLQCGARFAWGIEPVQRHIELGSAYAAARGVENCKFLLCADIEIPLPDQSIDVVVSYDVLEHVADPRRSIEEIKRVLVPGGRALLVFPVYDGALSHHLDYITCLPGLHWFFDPETLIKAVNSILIEDHNLSRFGTLPQPLPRPSYDGARRVLPTLNGLTGMAFQEMLRGFDVELLYFRPLWTRRPILGLPFKMISKLAGRGWLRDAVTTNVVSILVKA